MPAPTDSHRSSAVGPIASVVVAGLIFGAVGVWAAVTHHPSPILVVRYVAVGVAYLGVGYWLATKGYPTLGLLVAITGALWFIPEFQDTRRGALVGIAILLEDTFRVTFAHAVLAYPDGRIRPRIGTWFVGAGYVFVLIGGALRALTYQPYIWQACDCPRNGFSIWHTQSIYNAVNDPYQIIGGILGVALLVLLVVKLRGAASEGTDRRVVGAAVLGTLLILISGIVRNGDLSHDSLIVWLWVEGLGLLVTVLAMLWTRSERPAA
jgi:hypothetical protein